MKQYLRKGTKSQKALPLTGNRLELSLELTVPGIGHLKGIWFHNSKIPKLTHK